MTNIGETIKKIRESKGFTQKYVFDRSRITQSKLSLIENGEIIPTIRTLKRLAKVFETTITLHID